MTIEVDVPEPDEFLKSAPLYNKLYYKEEDVRYVANIIYFNETMDSYCPECNREATFKGLGDGTPNKFYQVEKLIAASKAINSLSAQQKIALPKLITGVHHLRIECTRNDDHSQVFYILIDSDYDYVDGKSIQHYYFQKIGQYPSIGDLNIDSIKKYRGILDKNLMGEFIRAIGLASHGIGIGAYVYLRRIFESLIEEAHQKAKEEPNWDETKYSSSRILDKVTLIKDFLPVFLVEHPHMYSILSKGIHQLSEDDCLKHFETLKVGIELILDEKLTKAQQEKKITEAKKSLGIAVEDVAKN